MVGKTGSRQDGGERERYSRPLVQTHLMLGGV
jgi:hypothetical protein